MRHSSYDSGSRRRYQKLNTKPSIISGLDGPYKEEVPPVSSGDAATEERFPLNSFERHLGGKYYSFGEMRPVKRRVIPGDES